MITVATVLFTGVMALMILGTMGTLILAAFNDGKTQQFYEEAARR